MGASEPDRPNRSGPPAWLRELDHTGDVALEVSAPTPAMLFGRAAWALFHVVTDVDRVAPREAQPVTVQAGDRDALLVAWLSELNFLHAARGWLFCEFDVQALDDRHLTALAHGERFDPDRHVIYTEIKAVTFHGLRLRQRNGVWHVQIVLDL